MSLPGKVESAKRIILCLLGAYVLLTGSCRVTSQHELFERRNGVRKQADGADRADSAEHGASHARRLQRRDSSSIATPRQLTAPNNYADDLDAEELLEELLQQNNTANAQRLAVIVLLTDLHESSEWAACRLPGSMVSHAHDTVLNHKKRLHFAPDCARWLVRELVTRSIVPDPSSCTFLVSLPFWRVYAHCSTAQIRRSSFLYLLASTYPSRPRPGVHAARLHAAGRQAPVPHHTLQRVHLHGAPAHTAVGRSSQRSSKQVNGRPGPVNEPWDRLRNAQYAQPKCNYPPHACMR